MTEWQASDYNRQSSLQQAMAEETLGRLSFEGSEQVLDVGCGDGKISAAIAERLPHGSVLGVDPSHDMVRFSNERFGSPVHHNLRFEVADARRLPYSNRFDRVVSFNALHWVPEQEEALRSIRAALKPEGLAYLRFVPEGERKSLEDVIERVRQLPRWADRFADFQTPYVHFTPERYRTLCEKSGFQVRRIGVEDKAWDFGSREAFVAFARATFVAWTSHLPESERDAFISEVLDRYQTVAATTPAESNTFKFYQLEAELVA